MIQYEVRRGRAVVITLEDAARALAFAEANSHPGLALLVYAVERREWLVREPPAAPIPFKGADRSTRRAAS